LLPLINLYQIEKNDIYGALQYKREIDKQIIFYVKNKDTDLLTDFFINRLKLNINYVLKKV